MYQAVVCRVSTRPHPNADRLQLGLAHGHQVVTGVETQDQELGVFFPCDGQLEDSFLVANDLYPIYENGNRVGGGFFCKNRRVRAQSFRGEKSDGYWCTFESLRVWARFLKNPEMSASISALKEGDLFNSVSDVNLCNKYINEKTKAAFAAAQTKGKLRKNNICFAEHMRTRHFRYELSSIPVGSILHVSEKLHGTSGRFGKVPEEKEQPAGFWSFLFFLSLWVLGRFGFSLQKKEHLTLVGTRRTIRRDPLRGGFYDDQKFRHDVGDYLSERLFAGEVIYGEHVGFVGTKPIMARHNPQKIQDRSFAKLYGKEITYTYGQKEGASSFHPYRITRVADGGEVVELSEAKMRARSHALGLNPCPLLAGPLVFLGKSSYPVEKHAIAGSTSFDFLENLINHLVDGPSLLDSSHPREGVIIRVDTPSGETYFLKDKSHPFKVMEGIAKDLGEVDIEEAS